MKKTALCLMITLMSFIAFPNSIMATETTSPALVENTEEIPEEIKVMLDRLDEIKDMDKSALNRIEKKALRKEVRTIKKDIRASGNGLYISSGAIIIILLVIIIL